MASVTSPEYAKKAKLSDGVTYGYVHVPAAAGKPTLLLLHGAPSTSYIWHRQVEALPKSGLDRPEAVEPYQMKDVIPQLYELVTKVVGLDKVIGVGHDIGSAVLSLLYVRHKNLFSGLAFLAVGFVYVDALGDVEMLNDLAKQLVGYPTSGYIHLFTAPDGVALAEKSDKALDSLLYCADPEAWKTHLGADGALRRFLEAGSPIPTADWISAEELDTHHRLLKGGYTGVFNWYKAFFGIEPSSEDVARPAEERKIEVPTLFVVAEKDYAIVADMHLHQTKEAAADLQVERLSTGHWVMLEATEKVNALLQGFAERIQG